MFGLSAQTAYFFFYSLFPILLFSAPLLSLVGDRQQTFQSIIDKLAPVVPPEAFALIQAVLHDVVFVQGAPRLISLGGLLALWMGSNVFSSLINALNRTCGVRETRPFWKTELLSLVFVVGAGVTMMIATVVLLFGHTILRAVSNAIGLGGAVVALWSVGQSVLVVALVVVVGSVALRVLPSQRLTWRQATAGSLLATILWLIVTVGFRLYVAHFPSYNHAYGAIGAVIVLLSWMYLSMLSVLAGGVFASQVRKLTGV